MSLPAAELVAALRGLVERAETDWRHRHLPPPTRDAPRPDAEALRGARTLEAVGRTLDAIGGQLRSLPVPGADRMRARHGADASGRLADADDALLAHAGFMLALLSPQADAGGAGADAARPDELQREAALLAELAQRRADLLA